MRFAFVDGKKQEATPGRRGVCPCCGSATVAKCGPHTIHHWAHKTKAECDPWWENESAWHRQWKDHFPETWQEVVQFDDSGEKHVADVRTANGMVIEFQHSAITTAEARSRERFYKKMMWIVDLHRNPNEFYMFKMGLEFALSGMRDGVVGMPWYGRSKLLHNWSWASVPVLFDLRMGDDLWLFKGFEKGETIEHVDRYVVKHISKRALIEKNGGTYAERQAD